MSILRRFLALFRKAPPVCPECGDPCWVEAAPSLPKGWPIEVVTCSGCGYAERRLA